MEGRGIGIIRLSKRRKEISCKDIYWSIDMDMKCSEREEMKQCESCGMPLDEKTTSKFDDRYCIHC